MNDRVLFYAKEATGLEVNESTSSTSRYLTPENDFRAVIQQGMSNSQFSFSLHNPTLNPVDVGGTIAFNGTPIYAFRYIVHPFETFSVALPKPSLPQFELLISSSGRLKISDITEVPLPASHEVESYTFPNPQITINAEEWEILEGGRIKARSLLNLYVSDFLTEDDYVDLEVSGQCLLKYGRINFYTYGYIQFHFLKRSNSLIFSISSQRHFQVRPILLKRKIINPDFVAPEASIWRLENQYAN